jgi:hypothetical protein
MAFLTIAPFAVTEASKAHHALQFPAGLGRCTDHFNAWRAVKCKGRTRQSAGPPLAVAALRAFQDGHDDVAEEAEAAQEIGVWPI